MALLAGWLLVACAHTVPVAKLAPELDSCEEVFQKADNFDSETWKLCLEVAEQAGASLHMHLGLSYWQRWEALNNKERETPWERGASKEKEKEILRAQALKWMKKAAHQGLPEAQFLLAMVYAQSRMVVRDGEMALLWLQKAAGQGDKRIQEQVANVQFREPLRPATEAVASRQCRRTALDEDSKQVRAYCQQAAQKGDLAAQYYVGWMYYAGYGVEQNEELALQWFVKAAQQGNATAQYYVGTMSFFGEGLGPDSKNDYALALRWKEAAKWLSKSAQQGDAYAQFFLGSMYRDAHDTLGDKAEAARLIRLAAEQGLLGAQYTLGGMYASGEGGVPEDKAESLKWYQKAADQGLVYAKEAIQRLQASGD